MSQKSRGAAAAPSKTHSAAQTAARAAKDGAGETGKADPTNGVGTMEWVNPVDRVLLAARGALTNGYRRLSTTGRRVLWVSIIAPTLMFITAASATADGGGMSAPSALSWINVTDSHDMSIWKYAISIDRGGVTSPGKVMNAFFIDLFWGFYLSMVAIAAWLIDWVISFGWLDLLADPIIAMGDALGVMVQSLGITGALLTITAVAAMFWAFQGKLVLAVFEILIACTIAALSVGIFADPVRDVVEQGGVLTDARDVGLVAASGLQNEGDTTHGSSGELREELTQGIADAFVRGPFQMANFGTVLDGTDCEDEFQTALEGGPYGEESDLRDAVKACNEDAGTVAENPNANMSISAAMLVPAGGLALLFAIVLCGVVLVAGLFAAYQSLKMIVALVFALLPGGARGSLWKTFADLIISLVTVTFSVVFLAAYLLMITALFASGEDGGTLRTFIITDLLMLAGLIVFLVARKRLKAASDRLAEAFSKRPGAGPSALPGRTSIDAASMYYKSRAVGAVASRAVGASAVAAGVLTGGASTAGVLAGRAGKALGTSIGAGGKGLGKVAAVLASSRGAATSGGPDAEAPSGDADSAQRLTTLLESRGRDAGAAGGVLPHRTVRASLVPVAQWSRRRAGHGDPHGGPGGGDVGGAGGLDADGITGGAHDGRPTMRAEFHPDTPTSNGPGSSAVGSRAIPRSITAAGSDRPGRPDQPGVAGEADRPGPSSGPSSGGSAAGAADRLNERLARRLRPGIPTGAGRS